MGLVPLRSAGNVRVVICRGDGSEAGRLVSFPAVVAADRRVVPDSGYGVSDSFGSRSGGRAAAVSDFLRGSPHPCSAAACFYSGS